MAGDAADFLAFVPDWVKASASAGIFLSTLVGGLWIGRRAKREEAAKDTKPEGEHESFDPEELMETSGIKRFIAAVEELAINTRIIAEGVKTQAAAQVTLARIIETDFNEKRVDAAVERRAQELAKQRANVSSAMKTWGSDACGAHAPP